MPILHGVNLSPFVRKVRVALAEKGIEYDQVEQFPMNQSDEYLEKSPLGKIPCWEDGDFVLPDSSCIIAFLERSHPEPALYPRDTKEFGRALWYEEYGDTRLVESASTVFFQRVVRPRFLQQETDEEAVADSLENQLPPLFDYLEKQLSGRDFLAGEAFSIADISVTSALVNFHHVGEKIDKARWPKLAAYIERNFSRPSFGALVEEEAATFAQG